MVCTLKSGGGICFSPIFQMPCCKGALVYSMLGFQIKGCSVIQPWDIIKLILEPPETSCQAQDCWLVSLKMALTLKEIWYIRNAVIHQKGTTNLKASIGRIGEKFKECTRVFSHPQNSKMAQLVIRWSPPPPKFIKLNVDAAIAQNTSALAVVARNEQGAVLMAWSKIMPKRSPIATEAEAILWALHLANGKKWRKIIVESDSKICIDSILDHTASHQWAISSLVSDIWLLEKSFVSCLFFGLKEVETLLLMKQQSTQFSLVLLFLFVRTISQPL